MSLEVKFSGKTNVRVRQISRKVKFSEKSYFPVSQLPRVDVASLEWGQAPKPPSFVALRATTQSTRWSLTFLTIKKQKIMEICELSAVDGSMDEDGKAGSSLVVNGNRVSRLVVEDFVEIWALGVRKA